MSSEDVSTERLTQKPWPAPFVRSGREDFAVIFQRQRLLLEGEAALFEDFAVLGFRINNGQSGPVKIKMALQKRQRAPADGAKSDHDDRAGDFAVDWPF